MITSLGNSRIKHLTALREKTRERNREGLFLAEGIKMFEEAPLDKIKEVYCGESFYQLLLNSMETKEKLPEIIRLQKAFHKLEQCGKQGIFTERLSDEALKKAADTMTPQGILFVMEQFSYSLEDMLEQALGLFREKGRNPLFLILEDIQDPGNLGTMIRTGEGAGVSGVILSKGCVDIYNPKTIRSTMGSLYRVPFVYRENLGEAVKELQKHDIRVYAAHLKGEQYFDRIDYSGGSAFLVGNEGNGLKEETADLADAYIKIPMEGSLESLNAAVAAALLLYQAAGYNRKDGK
ncbi:MAG: RNA methyltransferase [Lachnospiraceae bacterium]|nr:RNA methyltransferase [Lachnospiraceae bacterium]